ncbi:MAG: histidine--tRNA ligase [Peptococcaceae bacterium]|jgi:histidyl-tRNA synthetase|nr:histidine--tRNA ligase [Peptococcaceae bacterium]
MTLNKAPVKGMKDILPAEMAVRDYVVGLIKDTYRSFGFTPIETPCLEHIANLTSKQGGENESLIFKILKRGEKLSLAGAVTADDLVDSGLRYDLTVSLCRFYANNQDKLPAPFKAMQIGPVWRADRPQKGRFRQFTQCDIDILGDASPLAEIELLTAAGDLLSRLGFRDFTIRVNHRQLLRAMADYSGFPPDSYDKVFIILDKIDKIGLAGVASELRAAGFPAAAVDTYIAFFRGRAGEGGGAGESEGDGGAGLLTACEAKLAAAGAGSDAAYEAGSDGGVSAHAGADGSVGAGAAIQTTRTILDCAAAVKTGDYRLLFDPTLVRGMGYYTGPIFEISVREFGSSVGGGGRYDQLVSSFTNLRVPACGFSIGFERVVAILLEQGFQAPAAGRKIAFLAEKGLSGAELSALLREAGQARQAGATVLVAAKNKNSKFQREQLQKEGYGEFRNFHRENQ